MPVITYAQWLLPLVAACSCSGGLQLQQYSISPDGANASAPRHGESACTLVAWIWCLTTWDLSMRRCTVFSSVRNTLIIPRAFSLHFAWTATCGATQLCLEAR